VPFFRLDLRLEKRTSLLFKSSSMSFAGMGRRREHLARARSAVHLADRIVDCISPLSVSSTASAVMALYREAAFWAVTGNHEGPLPATMVEAVAGVDNDVLTAAAGDGVSVETLREALLRTFVDSANLTEAQRVDEVALLHRISLRLIEGIEDPERSRRRVKSWVAAAAAISAVALLAAMLVFARGRDLAAHRPWKASSTFASCDLANGNCLGQPVDIFFHTLEEDSPWVEIDLGRVETFSTVAVRNRLDCCRERATPLAIEVSTDASTYKQVARRDEIFTVWDAKFPPVQARYVRARALRRTTLHLERLSVR
jgi:hypothetical protein